MAKNIEIVACSGRGGIVLPQHCMEALALMGEHDHPEVSMHTHHPFIGYMEPSYAGRNSGRFYTIFRGKENYFRIHDRVNHGLV
jgi:hypothetical protein